MQQNTQTAAQLPARLRFAARPTGHLTVEAARDALYNWIWARKLGGTFVLRIEDAGTPRSTEESTRDIVAELRWLGLHWDEGLEIGGAFGPYRQSARQVIYHAEADRLLLEGKAYRCFCTPSATLPRSRKGENVVLAVCEGGCRGLDPREASRRAADGERHSVRFAAPASVEIEWLDLVYGEIRVEECDDITLLDLDGNPTEDFAAVVDDAKMCISHVIQSQERMREMPARLALFDALGWVRPEVAHLPRITAPRNAGVSGGVAFLSIDTHRNRGILPQAMSNALAFLGWRSNPPWEVLTREQIVRRFDLKDIDRTTISFTVGDIDRLNHGHFELLPVGHKVEALFPQMKAHGLWPPGFRVDLGPTRHFRVVTGRHEDKIAATIQPITEEEWMRREPTLIEELPRLAAILEAVGDHLGGPHDVDPVLGYFYMEGFAYDPEAVSRFLAPEGAAERLERLAGALEALPTYTPEHIESVLGRVAAEVDATGLELQQAARVAVTGKGIGPPLVAVLHLIGQPQAVARLRRAGEIARFDRALPPARSGREGGASPDRVPAERPPAPPAGHEPAADVDFAGGGPDDDTPRGA